MKAGNHFNLTIENRPLTPEEDSEAETITSSMDLFFNLSSNSGGWSAKEIIEFQSASGLTQLRVEKFSTVPRLAQLIAQKI